MRNKFNFTAEFSGQYSFRSSLRFGIMCFSGGGSDSSGTTTPQSTPKEVVELYRQYLPSILATTANQADPVANELAGATARANPIYTASGLSQLNNYAPGYQQAGARLAEGQALSNAELLGGGGGLVAMMGAGLNNLLNPAQAAANKGAVDLVNSININGLSGSEQAAIERSLNQSNYARGNMGLDNATNTVSNAMNFGNALQAKRAELGNALNAATNVAQAQNTQFNPFNAAMNAGNASSNFGLSQYAPQQANAFTNAPLAFGSSFGNQLVGIGSSTKGTTVSGSDYGGCYLTTACCEYKGLPDDCEELTILRQFRDSFVPKELVKEYYQHAPIIVDKIKGNSLLLDYIYGVITQCVKDIKGNNYFMALARYTKMVKELK